uniref:Uncharacterized protein n=1 Tax=Timema shepardi TaxID=629360 RepID=A0A7R9ATP5_TIMSH|nr:unnamed protein product [Timema shepardi]
MIRGNQGKASHDPGWNDPPLFSYDASKSGGQPKRGHVLNKRVAFPLGPKSESTSKIPTSNPSHPLTMPPLPPVSALPPSSSLPCSKPEEAPSNSGFELIPPPVLTLKGGDGVLADQIHIGLMVDHVSLCSPWMAGRGGGSDDPNPIVVAMMMDLTTQTPCMSLFFVTDGAEFPRTGLYCETVSSSLYSLNLIRKQ